LPSIISEVEIQLRAMIPISSLLVSLIIQLKAGDKWVWSTDEIILAGENRRTLRKFCLSATSLTKYLTFTVLLLNQVVWSKIISVLCCSCHSFLVLQGSLSEFWINFLFWATYLAHCNFLYLTIVAVLSVLYIYEVCLSVNALWNICNVCPLGKEERFTAPHYPYAVRVGHWDRQPLYL